MYKYNIILLTSFFLYSLDKQDVSELKAQRRALTVEHMNLVGSYCQCECPESGTYTLYQKIFSSHWVARCKDINRKLTNLHEKIQLHDTMIERLNPDNRWDDDE